MEVPTGFASFGAAIEKVTGSLPKEQLDRTGQSILAVSKYDGDDEKVRVGIQ